MTAAILHLAIDPMFEALALRESIFSDKRLRIDGYITRYADSGASGDSVVSCDGG